MPQHKLTIVTVTLLPTKILPQKNPLVISSNPTCMTKNDNVEISFSNGVDEYICPNGHEGAEKLETRSYKRKKYYINC